MRQDAQECVKCCKFYKGEEKSPFESMCSTDNSEHYHECNMFWFYEKCWCGMGEQERTEQVREYAAYGLSDFNKDDGTPISLKALLFNRYCHWCGGYGNDAEGFKAWYIKTYCNLKK